MNVLTGLLSSFVSGDKSISLFGQTYDVALNWLGKLIKELIEGVGIVGVGIILFSVILKLVVLPFDIYQRVSMSKQNLKMKENQDKLEKLQKQYASDKAMYNQKMMEMYKENGISMCSSCLPAIISIVIFFVAINAFTSFSQYANLASYNRMVETYNAEIKQHMVTVDDDFSYEYQEENGKNYILVKDGDVATSGRYIYLVVENTQNFTAPASDEVKTFVRENKNKNYFVDSDFIYGELLTEEEKAAIEALFEENATDEAKEEIKQKSCVKYVETLAQKAVQTAYRTDIKNDVSFLWVKNIWETDASYKNPVSKYSEFKSDLQKEKLEVPGKNVKFTKIDSLTDAYTKDNYEKVTNLLNREKKEANGYYILIALSIGTILLQQFISMRSQKEQQKFSSVDGSGALNQKTMMVMMTVMFGIFAFMYSASFSIYMIVSNLLSLVTTVAINALVAKSMEKKEAEALQKKYNQRFPGREKKEDKNKNKRR